MPQQLELRPLPKSGTCPRCGNTCNGPSPFTCSDCGHYFTLRAAYPRAKAASGELREGA